MTSDDSNQLADIVHLIELIRSHLEACNRQMFLQDRHRIDATAYRLQAIGEASIRLSDGIKANYQEIPWADIRDMRHMLSHHYGKVDPTIVWSVYFHHLDLLYDVCINALNTHESN